MTAERVALDALTDRPHEAVFPGAEPRTVRLSLDAGEAVPAHTHPERTVVCHVLEGHLDVRLDGESNPVQAGEVLRFDGRREVSPRAEADAEALLVLAKRVED